MSHRLVLPFREALDAVNALAKIEKHAATAGKALLTYASAERMKQLIGLEEGRLFLRAEGPMCMLQLSLPCEVRNIPEGWKGAIQPAKLLSALKFLKKEKPEKVTVSVLRGGLKIGKITIKAEDHEIFCTTSPGITKAKVLGKTVNPFNAVARVEHCVGDDAVPSVAILSGQLLSARNNQAITVDCEIIPAMQDERLMVPIKDLLRVRALDDTVEVRLSETYVVFKSDEGLLAIRRQPWSSLMDDALALFQSASYVDEVEAEREGLLFALKTAKDILGPGANAMLTFREGIGHLRSALEGDEVSFDFCCSVTSKKCYSLGMVVRMLLDAVTHSPEPKTIFKIPDLSGGPMNMIHLVDSESHEVIGLGVTGQLREDGGTEEDEPLHSPAPPDY